MFHHFFAGIKSGGCMNNDGENDSYNRLIIGENDG